MTLSRPSPQGPQSNSRGSFFTYLRKTTIVFKSSNLALVNRQIICNVLYSDVTLLKTFWNCGLIIQSGTPSSLD